MITEEKQNTEFALWHAEITVYGIADKKPFNTMLSVPIQQKQGQKD